MNLQSDNMSPRQERRTRRDLIIILIVGILLDIVGGVLITSDGFVQALGGVALFFGLLMTILSSTILLFASGDS